MGGGRGRQVGRHRTLPHQATHTSLSLPVCLSVWVACWVQGGVGESRHSWAFGVRVLCRAFHMIVEIFPLKKTIKVSWGAHDSSGTCCFCCHPLVDRSLLCCCF